MFEIADRYKMLQAIRELEKSLTKEVFFEELRKATIDTIPGTKFGYSGAGAELLGYCLESIYNKFYEEILKEKIWSPLKMDHTKITVLATDNLTQGHNDNHRDMPFIPEKDVSAGGGIKSTVNDMMKYAIYHLDENNAIIKKSHQKMLGLWDEFDNGMFWQMFIFKDGPNKIFQNGGSFGTACWMTLIPENQIAVFIITNQNGQKTHDRLDKAASNIIENLTIAKDIRH